MMAYDARGAIVGREVCRIVAALHAALESVVQRGMAAGFSCRRPHALSALIAPKDLRALTARIGRDRIVESSGPSGLTARVGMTGLLFSVRRRVCRVQTSHRRAVPTGLSPGCR